MSGQTLNSQGLPTKVPSLTVLHPPVVPSRLDTKFQTEENGARTTTYNTKKFSLMEPQTGVRFNNMTLIKGASNIFGYLPSINPTRPIAPQIKKQAKMAALSLAGRAKNAAIQTIQGGVGNFINYTIKGRPRRQLISNGEIGTTDASPYTDWLGQPQTDYIKLILPETDTEVSATVETSETEKKQKLEFFDAHAIITVSEAKNILLTVVQGRDKTRKELISGGDLKINVSGKIVSRIPKLYPYQDVRNFVRIMQTKDVIPVQSPFLNIFGINGLIVLDYSLPQQEGFHNVQNYSFSAVFEQSTAAALEEVVRYGEVMEATIAKANKWIALDAVLEKLQVDKVLMGIGQ